MDAEFLARLTFTRTRAAMLRGKVKLELAEIADLIETAGGERLGVSSWSQIFAGKQPLSAKNALALARIAELRVGWLLANEGEPPAGYVAPAGEGDPEPAPESYGRRMPLERGRPPGEGRAPKKRGA